MINPLKHSNRSDRKTGILIYYVINLQTKIIFLTILVDSNILHYINMYNILIYIVLIVNLI